MMAVLMKTPVPITVPTTRAVVAGSVSPRTRWAPSCATGCESVERAAEDRLIVMSDGPPNRNRRRGRHLAPFARNATQPSDPSHRTPRKQPHCEECNDGENRRTRQERQGIVGTAPGTVAATARDHGFQKVSAIGRGTPTWNPCA